MNKLEQFKKGDYVKPMGGGICEPTGKIIGILPRKGSLKDPHIIVEFPDEDIFAYSYKDIIPSYPTEPVGICVCDENDKSDPCMLGGVVLLDKEFTPGWCGYWQWPVRNGKVGKPVYVDRDGYYCK